MNKSKKQPWRVVYGENYPSWEQSFPTKRAANAFAKKHKSFGDKIFSIAQHVPGEGPQCITAAIDPNYPANVAAAR